MATKQGRVRFKDIRQGKTFWRVNIRTDASGVRLADKPFRMFITTIPRLVPIEWGMRIDTADAPQTEWTVYGHCDHEHSLLRVKHDMALEVFGISKDGVDKIDPVEDLLLFRNKRSVDKFIKSFLMFPPTVSEHLEAVDMAVRDESFERDQDHEAEQEQQGIVIGESTLTPEDKAVGYSWTTKISVPVPAPEDKPDHANDNTYMLAP